MIKSKFFENERELNDFIANNSISIVSIETQTEKYDTGLPVMNGGSFITNRKVLKLWYKELTGKTKWQY